MKQVLFAFLLVFSIGNSPVKDAQWQWVIAPLARCAPRTYAEIAAVVQEINVARLPDENGRIVFFPLNGIITIDDRVFALGDLPRIVIIAHEARHLMQARASAWLKDGLLYNFDSSARVRVETDANQYALQVWEDCGND